MANEGEIRAYLESLLNAPGTREELEGKVNIFKLLMGDRPYPRQEVEDFMLRAEKFWQTHQKESVDSPAVMVLMELEERTDGFTRECEFVQKGGHSGSMLDQLFEVAALNSTTEEELDQMCLVTEWLLSFGLYAEYGKRYSDYQLDVGIVTRGIKPENAALRVVYRPQPKNIIP